MINPFSPPIPQPSGFGTDMDRLFALIGFISDQKACAARLADLMQKAADSAEIIGIADKVKAEIAADRAALATERDKQGKQIAADRKAFEDQCHSRDRQINDRARETERLNAKAQAARDEADLITADLKARLERVKAAAA